MKFSNENGLLSETFRICDQNYIVKTNSENILRMLSSENEVSDLLQETSNSFLFELYVLVLKEYSNFRICDTNFKFKLDPLSPLAMLSDGKKRYLLIKDDVDFYSVRWAVSTVLAQVIEQTKDIFSLHASCVWLDGVGGVVFVGNKNSGKSSLIATLLARYDARFVSDDTTMIECSGNAVSCFGIFGGLNLVDDNKNRIRRKTYDTNENATTQKSRYVVNKDKRILSSRINFLIFPNWQGEHDNCELKPYMIDSGILQSNMVFEFDKEYSHLYQMFLKSNIPSYVFNMCHDIDENCLYLIEMLKKTRR